MAGSKVIATNEAAQGGQYHHAVAGGFSCATTIVTELLRTAPTRYRVVVLTSWDRRLSEGEDRNESDD
jgi:hypothetical protein